MIDALFLLPQRTLIALVRGYRCFLSPWLGSSCRFDPTCSAYSLQALQQHGATAGAYLTLGRLVRCHPFCQGGHDPVPASAPRLFAALPSHAATKAGDTTPTSAEKTLS